MGPAYKESGNLRATASARVRALSSAKTAGSRSNKAATRGANDVGCPRVALIASRLLAVPVHRQSISPP